MLLDIYLYSKPFDIKTLMKYYSNIANMFKATEKLLKIPEKKTT